MQYRNDYMAVNEFHSLMGLPQGINPTVADLKLRRKLFEDEAKEYLDEFDIAIREAEETGQVSSETMKRLTSENVDVRYILAGDAVAFGLPTDVAFNRIHAANMRKVGPDGKPIRNEWGKVVKPAGWRPANLDDLFAE